MKEKRTFMRAKVTLRCSYMNRETENTMYQQYQKRHHQAKWDLKQQQTHTHTLILGTIQMDFCLQGSFVQRVADGMLETAEYTQAGSYWRLTTFFTVCASVECFQGLFFGSKRHFPALHYSHASFLPPPSLHRGCHIPRAEMEDWAKWPHFTDQHAGPASYSHVRGRRRSSSTV